MRIVPVIDILNGVVVRAVGGRRKEYRPIQSMLTDSIDPLTVARAMADAVNAQTIYVADLDAITSERDNLEQLLKLTESGFEVWADIGIATVGQLRHFESGGRVIPVIGSETVRHLRSFEQAVQVFGERGVIASVDLRGGELLGRWDYWGFREPLGPMGFANEVYRRGVRRFIVLDLEAVGEGWGVPTLALCDQLKQAFRNVQLIVGGGVRNREDVAALEAVGVDAALVSTAIHKGQM